MAIPHRVKVLNTCRVSPPPGSVAETSLPLTFFDVIWLQVPSVQQIFFYQLTESDTTSHFLDSLKPSLSLALRLFVPLSGTLYPSPKTGELEIRYKDGDSVQLTIAESDSDFEFLTDDRAKEMALLKQLVPDLTNSDSDLLSVQVTVFPNSGVSIGVSIRHVAADGTSTMQFVKHWASICRLGVESSSAESVPVYERVVIPDPNGLKRTFVEQMEDKKVGSVARALADTVAATFVLGRARIERLRQRVAMARPHVTGEKLPDYSPFSVSCAHVWVCLVRARAESGSKTAQFKFDSGCRGLFDPPIPAAYFGNCIRPCFVRVGRADLAGENGIWVGCEAIWGVIQAVKNGGDDDFLEETDGWIASLMEMGGAGGRLDWLSWSPKIGVYDLDFGMGRPRKVEVISMDGIGAMSLMEGRDGDGFEVGLSLSRLEMESFASMFEEGLE